MTEHRRCRCCRYCRLDSEPVYVNGVYHLVKYNVRHYAHPVCLAKAQGSVLGRQLIPEHQRASYDRRLSREPADSWERGLWEVKDEQIARHQAAIARLQSDK